MSSKNIHHYDKYFSHRFHEKINKAIQWVPIEYWPSLSLFSPFQYLSIVLFYSPNRHIVGEISHCQKPHQSNLELIKTSHTRTSMHCVVIGKHLYRITSIFPSSRTYTCSISPSRSFPASVSIVVLPLTLEGDTMPRAPDLVLWDEAKWYERSCLSMLVMDRWLL